MKYFIALETSMCVYILFFFFFFAEKYVCVYSVYCHLSKKKSIFSILLIKMWNDFLDLYFVCWLSVFGEKKGSLCLAMVAEKDGCYGTFQRDHAAFR